MKFSCTQENLYRGLFATSHVASKSTNLPILNNILIKIEDKTIKFLSTNLEMGISSIVRGKVEQEGEFTVNSKLFFDYISLLPNERVDLEVKDQFLEIHCQNFNTKIKGIAASEFPLIPQIEKQNHYQVAIEDFKKALSQVIFAVAVSETRPEINGVYFQFEGNQLVLAATDSYRLAEKRLTLKHSSQSETKKAIIPTKTLQEIQRLLSGANTDTDVINMYLEDNQVLFVLDHIELVSRLIEGVYPDYAQILGANYNTQVKVQKDDFSKAVKSASLFSRMEIYDINMHMSSSDQKVKVVSTNSQLGESVSDIAAEYQGEDNNIVLNYKYLLDGINNINSDRLLLKVIDDQNHCVLQSPTDENYLYVIMPIKH